MWWIHIRKCGRTIQSMSECAISVQDKRECNRTLQDVYEAWNCQLNMVNIVELVRIGDKFRDNRQDLPDKN